MFFPSGEYGEVYCYLIRQGNGSILISRGDGDVVGIGAWKQEGSRVAVNSRIVYRTVVFTGKPIPEPETIELLEVKKGRFWTVWDDKGHYIALSRFKDWGYLASLIRCDRSYFDGTKETDGVLPCAPQPEN